MIKTVLIFPLMTLQLHSELIEWSDRTLRSMRLTCTALRHASDRIEPQGRECELSIMQDACSTMMEGN